MSHDEFTKIHKALDSIRDDIKEIKADSKDIKQQLDNKVDDKRMDGLFNHTFLLLDQKTNKDDIVDKDRFNGAIGDIYGKLDRIIGFFENDEVERAAIGVQVGRHEKWIKSASRKVAVPYKPSA